MRLMANYLNLDVDEHVIQVKEWEAKNQVIIEVKNVSDNTASDAWRPTPNGKTEIISGKVQSIDCTITWKDQGWGNRKGGVKVALMRNHTTIAEFTFAVWGAAPHAKQTQHCTLRDNQIVTLF